jgi:hypothetical protein
MAIPADTFRTTASTPWRCPASPKATAATAPETTTSRAEASAAIGLLPKRPPAKEADGALETGWLAKGSDLPREELGWAAIDSDLPREELAWVRRRVAKAEEYSPADLRARASALPASDPTDPSRCKSPPSDAKGSV